MSPAEIRLAQASRGALGWLRWALIQKTDNPTRNLVLIIMAAAANKSGYCYLANKTIAQRAQIHTRTVQYIVDALEIRDFIRDVSDEFPHRRTKTYRMNG